MPDEGTLEGRVQTLEEQVAMLGAAAVANAEPSGYYTSKYSGEEIDALLDKIAAL